MRMNSMKLSTWPRRVASQGMSLVEMMIGMAVGSLVLMVVAAVFVGSTFSFAAMRNYLNLDQTSRNALDQMTRDIRRSANLASFATNQMVFNYAGATNLVYTYNPSAKSLTSWKTGDTVTNVLLTGCDSLQFSMYGNVPQPGGSLTNATLVAKAKGISVNWRCSRTILGKKRNTEDMQEAVIIIRNKPVS
jgi:prepilin-type N-terminal cleavage/methylation domain-containing protein